ncbi:MAG: N-acetylmuramoyl-L-alanine amidase family protein [Longimicrobiales bacterium]
MKSAAIVLGLSAIAPLAAFDGRDASRAAPEITAYDIADASPVTAWRRPDGPVRVALQAGHWKAAEAPDEQAQLRTNGTRGGGKAEWEVNLGIARHTQRILEEAGYSVEILPTTIPPGYWADVFISIHADGSTSGSVSGYRAAAPRRDRTGRARELAALLTATYGQATGLPHYPLITRRMRGYYAFNSRRYRHALHPMTVGVILETGFLTSPRDRRIIVDAQDRAARGIADAVMRFIEP